MTTKLPIAKQLNLATGKQDCVCPMCDHKMVATVAGRVKKNSNHQSYKEFKGTCSHCRTIYSGILKLRG